MKKIILVLSAALISVVSFSRTDITKLEKRLWKTTPYDLSDSRLCTMRDLQVYMDSCSNQKFAAYKKCEDAVERAKMAEGNVLHFYQAALEKLVREIPSTKVTYGSVVIWHLYNMGYVVKTPSKCFGVDIMHPDAARLVPFLDFLAITHKHADHYTDAMNKAMTDAGKPVLSNWDSPYCTLTNLSDSTETTVAGIKVRTHLADHNAQHLKFVICYLIDCGEDADHCSLYFVGDSCSADQLAVGDADVDILVPHLQVGLNLKDASRILNPDLVLVSHILELGHPLDWARWNYFHGLNRTNELTVYGVKAILPVWGDRIEYTPGR